MFGSSFTRGAGSQNIPFPVRAYTALSRVPLHSCIYLLVLEPLLHAHTLNGLWPCSSTLLPELDMPRMTVRACTAL